jgi:hypothetical protein
LVGWRVFLPTTKAKQSKKEKYGHRKFHYEVRFSPRSVFNTKDSPVR